MDVIEQAAAVRKRLQAQPGLYAVPAPGLELFLLRGFLTDEECEGLIRLIDAGRSLVSHLELDRLLEELLEIAADVTGARYAALGILDQDRRELERFLTRGIGPESRRDIGDLPRGRRQALGDRRRDGGSDMRHRDDQPAVSPAQPIGRLTLRRQGSLDEAGELRHGRFPGQPGRWMAAANGKASPRCRNQG